MVAPPILTARFRNGTISVGRLLGGTTFSQIGNTFSSAEAPGAYDLVATNRAIQFRDGLYVYQRDEIRKFNSGTSDWDVVHTLTNQNTTEGFSTHIGLFILNVNDTPRLYALYTNTSIQLQAAYSEDGTSWTDEATTGVTATQNVGRGNSRRINNTIISLWSDRSVIYTPTTNSAVSILLPGGSGTTSAADICVYNGRTFLIALDGSTSTGIPKLYELSAGAWNDVGVVFTNIGNGTNNEANSRFCLFTDSTDLFVLMCQNDEAISTAQSGTLAFRLQDNGMGGFTPTNITTSVVPASIRAGTGTNIETHRWFAFTDNETDPDNPSIYIWFLNDDSTGSYSYFEWNGPAALMTPGNIGPAHGLALAETRDGGSEYIFTSGELSVEITDVTPIVGGIRLSFRAYGDPGPDDKIVTFRFNAEGFTPDVICTLTGTATGGVAVRVGNTVEDVDADGTTIYTVDWNASANGIVVGDSVGIYPFIV